MPSDRRPFLPVSLHRLVAVGSMALIFTLGLLAACPSLHAWVHESAIASHTDESHHDKSNPLAHDQGCVITHFEHGVTLVFNTAVPARTPVAWKQSQPLIIDELLLAATHYRLLPGRAPPAV